MNPEIESISAKFDPILGSILRQVQKLIITSTKDVFHDLISCMIEQQIHYRTTKRIFAKALERAETEHVSNDNFHLKEQCC